MKRPGAPLQNCLDLYDSVTSTTPGMCRGGVWTRMAWGVISWEMKTAAKEKQITSFILNIWKEHCRPVGKLLGIYVTVESCTAVSETS